VSIESEIAELRQRVQRIEQRLKPPRVRQSAQPTPDEGIMTVWSDSDDDKVYIVYNDPDAGVVKTELT